MLNFIKKNIINIIGPKYKQVLIYIYEWIIKKKYTPDDFPSNLKRKNILTLQGEGLQREFFLFPYRTEKEPIDINPLNLQNYCYEIIEGKKLKLQERHGIQISSKSLIPVAVEDEDEIINFEFNNKIFELNDLPINRYIYLPVEKGIGNISAKKNHLIVGKPIAIETKNNYGVSINDFNNVVVIFIDSLAFLDDIEIGGFSKWMPNTSKYFEVSNSYVNHYSDSEWTLPSMATIFTGESIVDHRIFNPKFNHELPQSKILSEYFQENDYFTTSIGGGWRHSPGYGYARGFDRTIYKRMMPASEVIDCFMETIEIVNDKSTFSFLTFLEAHHLLWKVPDISSQANNSIEATKLTPWYSRKQKSIDLTHSNYLTEIYLGELKRLDRKLSTLYNHIELKYGKNVTVCLMSDHGPSYLDDEKFLLKKSRMKVPLILRGNGIENKKTFDFTSTSNNLEIILNAAKISKFKDTNKHKNNTSFSVSHSIYPGKTYKSSIFLCDNDIYFETINTIKENNKIIQNINDRLWSKYKLQKEENILYKKIINSNISKWNL
jgi:hypothetical protein